MATFTHTERIPVHTFTVNTTVLGKAVDEYFNFTNVSLSVRIDNEPG